MLYWISVWFFTPRCYASLVYAVVCPTSVRLLVTNRYCIKTTGLIELVFGTSTYTTVVRKFGYLPKLGLWSTSLWNFVANNGHRKFCHVKSITLATKLVVASSMVEFVDTYTIVDDLWLMCRENFAKFIRVVSEICVQTDTLVTILESTTTAEKNIPRSTFGATT